LTPVKKKIVFNDAKISMKFMFSATGILMETSR